MVLNIIESVDTKCDKKNIYISIFYTIRLVKKKNISYACGKYIRKYAEGNTILCGNV